MSTDLTEQKSQVPAEKKVDHWLREPAIYERLGAALQGWGIGVDQFIAEMAIAFGDPKLRVCTEASKFSAAHDCATLGFTPSMDQVAFIPRNAKDGNGRPIVVIDVMPQWQGYKSHMERHPEILEVNAHLVHKSDTYDYDPINRAIVNHQFDPFDEKRSIDKLEDIKGGYLEIVYRDPRRQRKFHCVTVADIQKAKNCAQTKNVWTAWPRQMALKTVYRDGYSRRVVPIDPLVAKRMEAVLAYEDQLHQNDPLLGAGSPPAQLKHESRAARIAHQYSTDSQPQMPEPEVDTVDATATTVDDKAGKPKKSKSKKQEPQDASETGATDGATEHPALITFRKWVAKTNVPDAIWMEADKQAEELPDVAEEIKQAATERCKELQAPAKGQGSLLDQ